MLIDTDVLDILRAATCAGAALTLPPKLDRKLYTRVDAVLGTLGGKWNRKRQAHLFPDDAAARLAPVLARGEVTTAAEEGYFPTPPEVATALAVFTGIKANMLVLEPSAGGGALIDAIQREGAAVLAIEYNAERHAALHEAYGLDEYVVVHPEPIDFMNLELDEPVDAVLMNPPFVRVGAGDHLDHLRHAMDMLAPGGVLGAILPISVQQRTDRRHAGFRQWAAAHRGVFMPLPAAAFEASGTSVRTCMLRMVRV